MTSSRKPIASKLCLLAVATSLLICNVSSLRVGRHFQSVFRINLKLSAAPREGQFELSDYVNSNFLPQLEDGVSSKSFRAINPTFITLSSALQEYSGRMYRSLFTMLLYLFSHDEDRLTCLFCDGKYGKLESKGYVILVDLSVRSTDDLSLSCDRFPFWTKVRLICNETYRCDVLKIFLNVVQVSLSHTI